MSTASPESVARPPEGGPLYRITVLAVLAIAIGAITSLFAIAFVEFVRWLNDVLLISPRTRVQVQHNSHLVNLATIAVPTIGGLIVGILLRGLSKEKRTLGPPDVIKAAQIGSPLPDLRSGTLSTLSAAVSLGFGASVGQYGPMVYLGAMVGDFSKRLHVRVNNLPSIAIACGVAAAISTAFNAPIAGLVFAHEVVLRHYSMQAFGPTTVASATGYVIATVVFERPALFLISFDGVKYGYEFFLFIVIGILSAGIAIIFMRLVLNMGTLASKSKIPVTFQPAIAGLGVGLTALVLPDVLGIGGSTLRFATIEGSFEMVELAVLIGAKIFLTALCLGFGFAGGVFSPALLIGILFGAFCWTTLAQSHLIPMSGMVVYAICGMMAVTSPVIGAPLTTILIVFELTRNYDLTIAAMVAVVFSNLIAYRYFGRSLFDVQLARRGSDFSQGRDRAKLATIPVARCATSDFPTTTLTTTAKEAIDRLSGTKWTEAFVTDTEGVYQGVISSNHPPSNPDDSVATVLISSALVFDDSISVWEAMQGLENFVGDAVPLICNDTGTLTGVVTEAALISIYLDILNEMRREENAPA